MMVAGFAVGAAGQDNEAHAPARATAILVAQAQAETDTARSVPESSPRPQFQPTRNADPESTGKPVAMVTPAGALYHSLAIPGWGQLLNGKKNKALLFAAAETVCIGGFIYTNVRYRNATGSERDALRTDQNTFLIYFLLAKVLDIMDAYVDAQFGNYDVRDITPEALIPEQ